MVVRWHDALLWMWVPLVPDPGVAQWDVQCLAHQLSDAPAAGSGGQKKAAGQSSGI